jgi:Domain of unknown function (DUF5071)
MDDIRKLLPTGKRDLVPAQAAVEAGYPAVEPILGELLEWMRDYNWPVARVLLPLFESIGAPLVPHIRDILQTDDDVWKYWVITLLIPSLAEDVAAEFRSELERICFQPRPNEKVEGLDEQARSVLNHFGWVRSAN